MFKIITAFNNKYEQLYELTAINKQEYAKRNNYELIRFKIEDESMPVNWTKLSILLSNMTGSGDWLFWSDVDSLIMNFNIKLEDFIPDDKIAIFGLHCVDMENRVYFPHGGNFFIKDCETSVEFLTAALNRFGHEKQDRMMEERAFRTIISTRPELAKQISLIKLSRLCSVPKEVLFRSSAGFTVYTPGDFINHFMNPLTMEERIEMVKQNMELVLK